MVYVMLCVGIGGWQRALAYAVVVLMAVAVSWQVNMQGHDVEIHRDANPKHFWVLNIPRV